MFFPLIIFIGVSLVAYAGFVKLAARLLRYRVSWKSSFLFGLIMFVLVNFARWLDLGQPVAVAIGHGAVVLFGLVILGSWFFAQRGTDRGGTFLGWSGGIRLTALAFAMMLVVAFAIAIPAHAFLGKHLPAPP
jgi:hypothetical protein